MQHLSPEDQYQLRRAQMDADKKALEAEKTQQELERIVLDLEHRYGLLATGQVIDPRKATIDGRLSIERSNGSTHHLTLEKAKAQKAMS